MFLELFATAVFGLAAAGVAHILVRFGRGLLPRWLVPAAAGLAMIAFTVGSEYTWFARTRDALPESFAVVRTAENRSAFRPWTYLAPYTERFAAVDRESIRRHDAAPEQRLVDTYLFGRWSPAHRIGMIVDCAARRQAPLVEGVTLAEDGGVSGAAWEDVARADPVLRATCAQE